MHKRFALDEIEVFVEVVDTQGFSRAAAKLGVPATTVSAKIARLEERLGITLIQRTTRRLHLTPAGQGYYRHCVRALAEMAEATREIAAANDEPTGLLRITAPADIAQILLPPVVERFLAAYSKASVELVVANRRVDLIGEGVDLAVRVGPLDDSSLIVRKFRSITVGLWASAAYLERKGTPRTPADLQAHDLVRFSRLRQKPVLKSQHGDTFEIDISGRLASDDLDNLKTFIVRGNGIGLLPEFVGEDQRTLASLVRVLPDFSSEAGTVYFAYPAQRFVPQIVRAFIAMAAS